MNLSASANETIKTFLMQSADLNNTERATNLLELLATVYNWQDWIILVFDAPNATDAAAWLFRLPVISVTANDTKIVAIPVHRGANMTIPDFVTNPANSTVKLVYNLFNQNEVINPICFNLNKALNSTLATTLPVDSIKQAVIEGASFNQSCYVFALDSRAF
jgi:hypothetical protein